MKRRRGVPWLPRAASVLLAVAMAEGAARAQPTATITGDPFTEDATIYSTQLDGNGGGGTTNFAGRNGTGILHRLLIRFDLSALPPNAVIESVTLRLNVTNVPPILVGATHSLYRVTHSWVEGTGIGNGASGQVVPGAVTWRSRSEGLILWKTAGGDFVATPSAALNVGATFGPKDWTGPGLVADVQAWVSGAISNDGWILIGDEAQPQSARGYASAEATLNNPVLTVVYAPLASVGRRWQLYE